MSAHSAIVQQTTIEDKFEINPNSKFNILPAKGIVRLDNTAVATQYANVTEMMNGGNSTTLTYQLGENLFLDRGVYVEIDVPFILKPKTPWTGTAPTASDYMTKCSNFKDICFRRFGILSCLDQLNIQFNQNVVTAITNVQRAFEQTSEFYNGAQLDKWFPASQPDRFTDYSAYDSSVANPVIETLNEDGDKVKYMIPSLADNNIYSGGYSDKFNSRRIVPKFVGATLNQIRLTVKTHMYIPFSFFATPDIVTSLYGINQLTIGLTFMDNFVKRLFCISGDPWTVDFDHDNQKVHRATLRIKTYRAPDYVTNAIKDKNGVPKPYRIAYNRVIAHQPKVVGDIAAHAKAQTVTSDQLQYGSLPKSIYLSLHPLSSGGNLNNVPDFKGRISAIEAVVGNSTTTINGGVLATYNLAQSNGLIKDYESAIFTNGFVVKLDVSKDLSVGGSLIGSNIPTTIQFMVTFDSLSDLTTKYELRITSAFPSQLVYQHREFKLYTSLILSSVPYDIENQAAEMYAQLNLNPSITVIGAGIFGDIWSNVKGLAKKGFQWVKDNPETVIKGLGKAVRAVTGLGAANVPFQQNMIGGETLLLGAGDIDEYPFK